MRLLPYFLLLLATACVPLGTPITSTGPAVPGPQKPPEYYADKPLRYEDYTYAPEVRSVQCYVASGQPNEVFQPPVVPLGQSQAIMLEFDVLGEQSQRYTAKPDYWQYSCCTLPYDFSLL